MNTKKQATPIYTVNAEYGRLVQLCEEAFFEGFGSSCKEHHSPDAEWQYSETKRNLEEMGLCSGDELIQMCKEAFYDGWDWECGLVYVEGDGSLQGCWQDSDTKSKLDKIKTEIRCEEETKSTSSNYPHKIWVQECDRCARAAYNAPNYEAQTDRCVKAAERLLTVAYILKEIACPRCRGYGTLIEPISQRWFCQMATDEPLETVCELCWGTGRSDKTGKDPRQKKN